MNKIEGVAGAEISIKWDNTIQNNKRKLNFQPILCFLRTKFSTCDSQLCDRQWIFCSQQHNKNCDEYPFGRMETGYCVG